MSTNQYQDAMHKASNEFNSGEFQSALETLKTIADIAAQSSDFHHLTALCLKATKQFDEAERAFSRASSLSPKNVPLNVQYVNFLIELKRYDAAINVLMAALEKIPSQPLQLLYLLSSAQRANGELLSAEKTLNTIVSLYPDSASMWVNLGVVKRMLGKPEESLKCYQTAHKKGHNSPQAIEAEASAYLDLGDIEQAIHLYKSSCEQYPDYLPAFSNLTKLLWQYQKTDSPWAVLIDAIRDKPDNIQYRYSLLQLAMKAEDWETAEQVVADIERLNTEMSLHAAKAVINEGLERTDLAAQLFEKAIIQTPDNVSLLLSFVNHLLRIRDFPRANAIVQQALKLNPLNQSSWALQGTIWEVMNDSRADWLHRYAEFVKPLELQTPSEYNHLDDLLAEVRTTLHSLHKFTNHPIGQSVRGGSQTHDYLFYNQSKPIQSLKTAILDTISTYLSNFKIEEDHPFLSRLTGEMRYINAWSIKLNGSGHHISHTHSDGWISSAFYVDVPDEFEGADRAGDFYFGAPPHHLNLGITPHGYFHPQPGWLCMFPSYIWHGTIPFESKEDRMTVAYDIVPK